MMRVNLAVVNLPRERFSIVKEGEAFPPAGSRRVTRWH